MSKLKFELNRDGVKALMKSSEMMEVCEDYANKALSRLGDGYEVSTMVGKTRCNAQITAVTHKARADNSKNNSILKALGG